MDRGQDFPKTGLEGGWNCGRVVATLCALGWGAVPSRAKSMYVVEIWWAGNVGFGEYGSDKKEVDPGFRAQGFGVGEWGFKV